MNGVKGYSEDRCYFIAIKWLMGIKGIGRAKTRKIIEAVDDIEKLSQGDYSALRPYETLMDQPLRALLNGRNNDQLSDAYERNIQGSDGLITLWHGTYPEVLAEVHEPPLMLHYKGNLELLSDQKRRIAVVGTRAPSDYGRKYGAEIGKILVKHDIAVVSGMAMGIDAVAHRSAIDAGGESIGVLGCGVDLVYPKQNERIYRDILNRGLLLSEYGAGSPPHPIHFPERNRIIAGLSETCLVIEAAQKSGSLITAEMAMDLGRDVLALPGPIYSDKSIGCHELIQSGAEPIISLERFSQRLGQLPQTAEEAITVKDLPDLPVIRCLKEKGQATFEELLELTELSLTELMVSLDELEMLKFIENQGFFYHLSRKT